ncbi:MAG: tetratricopeptide repeat protein [Thermoproteota archaeon]
MGKLCKSRRHRTEEIIDLINEGKIDDALKIADDAEALNDIGISFGLEGAYEIAVKIFGRATQLNPNFVEAWYNKGLALYRLGRLEEALKCYDKAIRINPNDAKARALREEVRTLRDLQTKREKWKKEGYNVSGLEKLKMEDIDHVRNVLERFEQIVQRISTLEREVKVFGLRELEAKVSSLKNRMGDLNRIEKIKEYISRLQKRVSGFKKSKKREWERKISGWKERGYELPVLKGLLAKYSVQAEEKLRKYEQAIGELEKLKEDLKYFNISGFGFEVLTIEKNMKEGQDIDKIIGEISKLRAKMREKIKEEMMKWIEETMGKVRSFFRELESE